MRHWLICKNRRLLIFWLGQLTSRIGSFISYVALLLLVRELTGKNTTTAITGICQAVPGLIVGIWAGAIIDRIGKVKVMLVTDILRGLATLIIPLCLYFNCLQVWHLYLTAVLISLGTAFFQPAEMAIIPDIVEPDELVQANAMARSTEQIGGIIGPAMGAVLITFGGAALAFGVDSLTFFVSAACIKLMRVTREQKQGAVARHLLLDIKEGLGLILKHNPLKAVLLCCVAVNFAYFPLPVLLPDIAEKYSFLDITGLNQAQIFGSFITFLSAGNLVALITIKFFDRFSHLKYFLYYSNLTVAIGLLTVGLSHYLSLSLLAMAAIGYCSTLTEVRIISYIQSTFSGSILGRIFSIILTLAFGTIPISIFLGGWLADIAGVSWVLSGLGILLVLTSLIIYAARLLEGENDVTVVPSNK